MKVMVLGANGQLGHCLADVLSGYPEIQFRLLDKSQFDIADEAAYRKFDESGADVWINCAAYTKVDLAETHREEAFRINVTGPKLLGEYLAVRKIPVLHISTDYIYGHSSRPIQEDDVIIPVNYYGQSKWEGEEALRHSGARHIILRTSWLFSEYGHNFVKTMRRLANKHPEIKVVSDQIGSPTYAMDLAYAIVRIVQTINAGNGIEWGTYNFANKGAVSWYDFACEILKDRDVKVLPIPTSSYPTPAKRPVYSVLDSTLFENTFQWEIPDWKEALERCMVILGQ